MHIITLKRNIFTGLWHRIPPHRYSLLPWRQCQARPRPPPQQKPKTFCLPLSPTILPIRPSRNHTSDKTLFGTSCVVKHTITPVQSCEIRDLLQGTLEGWRKESRSSVQVLKHRTCLPCPGVYASYANPYANAAPSRAVPLVPALSVGNSNTF